MTSPLGRRPSFSPIGTSCATSGSAPAGEDWRLFVDNAAQSRYVEVFLVESWEEHERQHERETQHDASLLNTLDGLLVPGTHRVGHHYFSAPSQAAPDDSVP